MYNSPHVEFDVKHKGIDVKKHYSYPCFRPLFPFTYGGQRDSNLLNIEEINYKCPLKCKFGVNYYQGNTKIGDKEIDVFLDFCTKLVELIPQITMSYEKKEDFYDSANTEKVECVNFTLKIKDWSAPLLPVMLLTLFRYLDEFVNRIKSLADGYTNNFEKDFEVFQSNHGSDNGHGVKNGSKIISLEQFKNNLVNTNIKTVYGLWEYNVNILK